MACGCKCYWSFIYYTILECFKATMLLYRSKCITYGIILILFFYYIDICVLSITILHFLFLFFRIYSSRTIKGEAILQKMKVRMSYRIRLYIVYQQFSFFCTGPFLYLYFYFDELTCKYLRES